MVFNLRILVIAFVVLFLCSCTEKGANEENGLETVKLRQEWFPYAGYAGELMAAENTDSLNGLNLIVDAGSDNIDPVKLVLSGDSDFGVASADRILTANAKGAGLVAIGVINYKTPTCFLTRKESGITNLEGFSGKKVGVLTGTNTEYVYSLLKRKVDLKDVNEIEVPFDLGSFIANSYDVRPAFIYDEPVSLDMKNIEYNVIRPEDYGVDFLGTVYFTTQEFLKEKPEVVEAFVKTLQMGWKLALEKPSDAIALLKEYDDGIDPDRELKSLIKGKDYFKGDGGRVLYANPNRWASMAESLKELGVIEMTNEEITASLNLQYVK